MDNIEDEKSSFTCCSSSSTTKMGDNNEDEVPHVLAVDDNDVDRKLIERLLNRSSCKVTTTESAMSALEYLGIGDDQQNTSEASKYDLILTDYCMPGLTGYDLLKKIKESPEHKEIPVVIMSSENEPGRISKCLEEGAEMFMLKPLKLSDARTIRSQAVKSKH